MTALPEVEPLLQRMADELKDYIARKGISDPAFVGIHTGGVWIAEALRSRCFPEAPAGTLDIAFYRDDFAQNGLQQGVRPSELPFSIDDRHLILVDDVLMTGRTIRAALNEVFDYGRPASVTL
ncbi:MAG: bifunctional pyr operon transcriptional regulator/uracil phosphoribosyltransferase PyrR, partial [Pseudomonas sp.]